ncbi:Protein FLX-like 3 [Linum perenne]
MPKRKHRPHHPDDFLRYRDGHQHDWNASRPLHPHPAHLEQEIDSLGRERRRIITENETIIDGNRALQSEVTRAKDKIHVLGQMIPQLQAEKETQIRELIQTELKLEAELRSKEPLKSEVRQLRAEVDDLNTSLHDLSSRANILREEITEAKVENEEVALMKDDVKMLHKLLIEARKTLEYEKRAREERVQEKQLTEDNLVRMRREIENLRAEQKGGGTKETRFEVGVYEATDRSPEARPRRRFDDSYDRTWTSRDDHGRHKR